MNLRDQIQGVRDLKEREVIVVEWANPESPDGVKVIVRGMTGEERYRGAGKAMVAKGNVEKFGEASVETLIGCLLDPTTKKPIFEPADRDMLLKRSGAVIDRLIAVMNELSGLTQGAEKEAEKN